MIEDDHEYRRKNDVAMGNLSITIKDFIERYERDLKSQNGQLTEILSTIKAHDEFIKDIKPVYAKGMMAMGAACLGTIGIGVNWLWHHIGWR